MVPKGPSTPQDRHEEVWWKGPHHMDISDGAVLWLHQVPNLQKVTIASLYLEPQQFVRYQWLCERKKNTIISWSIFTEELIAYHDDVKSNSLFTQLINPKQKGPVIEHIQQFQKLSLRVEGIADDKLLDLFIGTLKDNIQHEVHLFEPT